MTPEPTLAERYGAWLATAMRNAGLDIDRQRGGGRTQLANALNVSQSTVARWLDGKVVPSPELFEAIADAVGVPVRDMLVETGIISAKALTKNDRSEVASSPITPTQAADALGVTDPAERAEIIQILEARARHHLRATDSDGGTGGAVAQ
ncbi:MAG: helix-turn-helix transcriptional regulator [Streptomyces sp.]|nr:helix-turn-helix transcriptional regulator [Streptomyces sp.]NUS24397.1 helix-turn-helix transcriptional regulator [Streptomyces sp.]